MEMSNNLMPGDNIIFSYRDKKGVISNRNLIVDKIEIKDGETLVGGNDLSIEGSPYRQFYKSNMKNLMIDNFALKNTGRAQPSPPIGPQPNDKSLPPTAVINVFFVNSDVKGILDYLLRV
jgi:hypothetical protein